MPSDSVSVLSGSSSVSSTVVTVKVLEVSPALNVTLDGTPEYSLACSPVPGVAVIGTVTDAVGASARVTVTSISSPSSTDSAATANETATPSIGVTLTSASAPSPATFSARTS